MPSPAELEPKSEWIDDEAEMEIDMSDDDDLDYDEMDEEEGEDEIVKHRAGSASNVPIWRLIEMSREDRFLKRELADFEDYDSFDRFADEYVGLSH